EARCLRGTRRRRPGEAQGARHGGDRVHRAEPLHRGCGPREREGLAWALRRNEDSERGGAIRGHGGGDGGVAGRGGAGAGARGVDGGEPMKATTLALALLPVSVVPSLRGLAAQDPPAIRDAQQVLSRLVETYGVSGTEGPVRDQVKALLPTWAKAETDTAGNLWVRVGQGNPVVVFVAHLDEIGFRVTGIRDDGSLELETRGGFYPSLFEAQPALVHADKGDVPGIFIPRDSAFTRHTPPSLRVDVGTTSKEATMARGVSPGNTITMPKQYAPRLRGLARACRAGPRRGAAGRDHQRRQRRLGFHALRRRGCADRLAVALLSFPRGGHRSQRRGQPGGHDPCRGRNVVKPSPRALLSVSDKRGIVELARDLVALGWEIVSTGGTAETLRKAGVPVIATEQ